MKVLRFVLLLAGSFLVLWGVTDYFGGPGTDTDQAVPKILLGFIAALASLLAISRR